MADQGIKSNEFLYLLVSLHVNGNLKHFKFIAYRLYKGNCKNSIPLLHYDDGKNSI